MATVSQKTLDWLYRVISSVSSNYPPMVSLPRSFSLPNNQRFEQNSHDPNQAYLDPNRTYNDVAQVLSQYPDFSPRTDVYSKPLPRFYLDLWDMVVELTN